MPSTVQNIIKDASGAPVGGAAVTIDLVVVDTSGNSTSVQGFYPATDYTINIPASVSTNVNGAWSIAGIPGNDGIEVADGTLNTTHWKITEVAGGVTRSYYIRFGEGISGSIWAGDYTDNNFIPAPGTFPNAVVLPTSSTITMSSALTRTNIGAALDLTFATDIDLDFVVRTSATGNLLLQYSTDNTTWFTLTTTSCATSGGKTTGYQSIPASMRRLGYWQLATSGGSAGSAQLDFMTLIYK